MIKTRRHKRKASKKNTEGRKAGRRDEKERKWAKERKEWRMWRTGEEVERSTAETKAQHLSNRLKVSPHRTWQTLCGVITHEQTDRPPGYKVTPPIMPRALNHCLHVLMHTTCVEVWCVLYELTLSLCINTFHHTVTLMWLCTFLS